MAYKMIFLQQISPHFPLVDVFAFVEFFLLKVFPVRTTTSTRSQSLATQPVPSCFGDNMHSSLFSPKKNPFGFALPVNRNSAYAIQRSSMQDLGTYYSEAAVINLLNTSLPHRPPSEHVGETAVGVKAVAVVSVWFVYSGQLQKHGSAT